MRECRTTHYEGCACHEARHAAEVAALRERLAALEPVARAAVAEWQSGDDEELMALRKAVEALPEEMRKELAGQPIDWDAPAEPRRPQLFHDDGATTPEQDDPA